MFEQKRKRRRLSLFIVSLPSRIFHRQGVAYNLPPVGNNRRCSYRNILLTHNNFLTWFYSLLLLLLLQSLFFSLFIFIYNPVPKVQSMTSLFNRSFLLPVVCSLSNLFRLKFTSIRYSLSGQ